MKIVDVGTQGLKVSQEGLGCMGMSTYIYGPSDDKGSLATLHRAIELEENVAAANIVLTQEEVVKLDEAAPIGIAAGESYTKDNMSYVNK